MTSETIHIIARFSPVEMEMYLQIGGVLPVSVERDYLRRQRRREQQEREDVVEIARYSPGVLKMKFEKVEEVAA